MHLSSVIKVCYVTYRCVTFCFAPSCCVTVLQVLLGPEYSSDSDSHDPEDNDDAHSDTAPDRYAVHSILTDTILLYVAMRTRHYAQS
jgi:hypothetical protein